MSDAFSKTSVTGQEIRVFLTDLMGHCKLTYVAHQLMLTLASRNLQSHEKVYICVCINTYFLLVQSKGHCIAKAADEEVSI